MDKPASAGRFALAHSLSRPAVNVTQFFSIQSNRSLLVTAARCRAKRYEAWWHGGIVLLEATTTFENERARI